MHGCTNTQAPVSLRPIDGGTSWYPQLVWRQFSELMSVARRLWGAQGAGLDADAPWRGSTGSYLPHGQFQFEDSRNVRVN